MCFGTAVEDGLEMYLQDPMRFNHLLRLKGMSHRVLARRVRVPAPIIALMAVGRCGVGPETARLVASVLGVPTQELFRDSAPGAVDGGRPAAPEGERTRQVASFSGLVPRQRGPKD
ncbi:hypothetical protein GCM10009544_32150 [Streptomyces stramineus]|uniref:HTH cro/C1-type domain-containing protein n=1 Tax=Streptomyces stramineus TaxID=173861 RepID=A0ABP3JYR5_9ACTN